MCEWIERTLVQGPGDHMGAPFVLDPFQRDFLGALYRLDPAGRRIVRRAVLGIGKGGGKTSLIAAVCLAELCGPTRWDSAAGRPSLPVAPDIPVAAASYEQASLLYGAARAMAEGGPLAPYVEAYDTELLLKGRPGRMFRVAAVAGTNDGGLPTAAAFDELHEFTGRKERVPLVIENSLAKRANGLALYLSTPGASLDSALGRLYTAGQRVHSGEVYDPSFLFKWYEADPTLALDDPAELRRAIRQANPASWQHVENIARRWEVDRIPEHEFRRYHLGQWATLAATWIAPAEYAACAVERVVLDGARVCLGFDGSYGGDSTALVGATVEATPQHFVLRVWERPEGAQDWHVPREGVEAAVADAMRRFDVAELACDPFYWEAELERWEQTYGRRVERYNTSVAARMGPACTKFRAAVVERRLTHDGAPVLARHLANVVPKETRHGVVITRDRTQDVAYIDAAVAAVIAHDRATWHHENTGGASYVALGSYL